MNAFTQTAQSFLHFFHRPFARLMTAEQFRYLACGGFMAVLDICLFSFCYNILLHGKDIHVAGFTVTAHVASMWIPFPFCFLLSFLLSRFVVFSETTLKKSTSLFRYILLVVTCVVLNISLIKFFVEICHLLPELSKVACTILVAVFSYLSQKYFTFKTSNAIPQTGGQS